MSRDYQGEYNSLYKEYLEYTETVDESIKDQTDMNKFYSEYILKYQSKRDYVVDAMNKIASEAKAEGIKIKERPIKYYKIKRSETMDELELEERAFKNEKECQKAYNDYTERIKEVEDDLKKNYSDNAIDKLVKEAVEIYANKIRKQYENERDGLEDHLAYVKKQRDRFIAEAKKNGWNIKRSEDISDIEERAKLETEKDYQNELNSLMQEYTNTNELRLREEKKVRDKYHAILRDMARKISKLADEAERKGFNVHVTSIFRNYNIDTDDLETRKKELINKLTDLEERKNAVLDNLETRALNTQEDYQKEYDKLKKEYQNRLNEKSKLIDDRENTLDKISEQFDDKLAKLDKIIRDLITKGGNIEREAKAKGFKLRT